MIEWIDVEPKSSIFDFSINISHIVIVVGALLTSACDAAQQKLDDIQQQLDKPLP